MLLWISYCFIPMLLLTCIMNVIVKKELINFEDCYGLLLLSIFAPIWIPLGVGIILIFVLSKLINFAYFLYSLTK